VVRYSLSLGLLLFAFSICAARSDVINVPVYIHEITDNDKGIIPQQEIFDALAYLNKVYKGSAVSPPTPFRFQLKTIEVVNNEWWFYSLSECEDAESKHYYMRTRLRQGGLGTLNIYTVDSDGWMIGCTTSEASREDGVVVDYRRIGTSLLPHEVAHWLGVIDHLEMEHNYMQRIAAKDEDRFTESQVAQMREFWAKWRRKKRNEPK
jgi:hypothetical protein